MASGKYLAADFGASSGRVMLAEIGDKLRLKELHRFANQQIQVLGFFQWDLLSLYHELKAGFAKAAAAGHSDLDGIGVDTWGVDFGLVGRNNTILGNPYCYRDTRTDGMMELAFEKFSKTGIYAATGNQFMHFNSIFQLLSMVETRHPHLDAAETLLFMPDMINLMMTGERKSEYTIATTSQLLNANTREWDRTVFEQLGLPLGLMAPLVNPGTPIGTLRSDILRETGLSQTNVIAPAEHDTGSAIAAVPAQEKENWAYISSGTWSLVGVEIDNPIINTQTLEKNFTNEGSVGGKIRFLRNATGMWLLEQCRKEWKKFNDPSYDTLIAEAERAEPFRTLLDPDDALFMNPLNMPDAICQFCKETKQPCPESQGQFVRVILESLTLRYRYILESIQELQEKKISVVHIVGGGCQNVLLNQFTADAMGIPVIAGPVEATAIGNVLMQAIGTGALASIEQGRALVAQSFPLETFEPGQKGAWDEAFERFLFMLRMRE